MAARHVINYREEDFVTMVKAYTGGKGVDVVYDSVGKDTFPGSLDCLKPLGMWVSFGQSSGPVPEFKITLLSQKGSLFATRPSVMHYVASRKDLVVSANELFEAIGSGKIKVQVNQTYPLSEAARAHRDLEGRLTTGSSVPRPPCSSARNSTATISRKLFLVSERSLRLVKKSLPRARINQGPGESRSG